jgi:hypothetical protein
LSCRAGQQFEAFVCCGEGVCKMRLVHPA